MQKSHLAFSIAAILFSLGLCQSATAISGGRSHGNSYEKTLVRGDTKSSITILDQTSILEGRFQGDLAELFIRDRAVSGFSITRYGDYKRKGIVAFQFPISEFDFTVTELTDDLKKLNRNGQREVSITYRIQKPFDEIAQDIVKRTTGRDTRSECFKTGCYVWRAFSPRSGHDRLAKHQILIHIKQDNSNVGITFVNVKYPHTFGNLTSPKYEDF